MFASPHVFFVLARQVEYRGFKVVDDVYCQHYEVSEEGPLAGFIITLYENYAEQKVHRIEFANVQWYCYFSFRFCIFFATENSVSEVLIKLCTPPGTSTNLHRCQRTRCP